MPDFYEDLAPLYHLIYPDWNASMERQGAQLAAIVREEWPKGRGVLRSVLDVACGIGTQAIGLAREGFAVTGSDLSAGALERAMVEAEVRGLAIPFSVCDMRDAYAHHGGGFDVVICCDNSLPHLLTDGDIAAALSQMKACLRSGGACLITVRDYEGEPRGRNILKPYAVRTERGKRVFVFQVWDFDGDCYDLSMYIVQEDPMSQEVTTKVMRTRYYAVPVRRLLAMMQQAGFSKVRRLESEFYQPVLVGTAA